MSCHSLSKAGGDVGPDLSSVGQTSPPDYIINSILNPDQAIKEQYHTLLVLTTLGQVFQGIVTDKDDQRIVLKEATGATRVVPVATIDDQKPGGSLMPKGLANLMTRSEFVDLVRFLSELGKPGPYAIPATLAIQRWKVLETGPRGFVELRPRSGSVPRPGPPGRARPLGDGLRQGRRLIAPGRAGFRDSRGRSFTSRVRSTSPSAERSGSSSIPPKESASGSTTSRLPPVQRALTKTLAAGTHSITLRIDTKARASREIKVEIDKPAGSPAEFTVVGGR